MSSYRRGWPPEYYVKQEGGPEGGVVPSYNFRATHGNAEAFACLFKRLKCTLIGGTLAFSRHFPGQSCSKWAPNQEGSIGRKAPGRGQSLVAIAGNNIAEPIYSPLSS